MVERRGYFWNGLTIPFIIGSRQYIEPSEDLQTISELINEINNSPYNVSVLKCCRIGEYVFSLSNASNQEIYGGVDNIVIIDSSFSTVASSNDIIKELELKYDDLIHSETYSKTDGEWGDYTDKEINLLIEINTTS